VADAIKQNSIRKEDWDTAAIKRKDAPRAVRAFINAHGEAALGVASEVEPKFTSHSDPSGQRSAARKGPAGFAYSVNYLTETD
jgi:hypothetical protein